MHREESWHDVMQVCLNGHQITTYAQSQPISRENFCKDCGEKTIDACPGCGTSIRGFRHIPGMFYTTKPPVPKYCINCGVPYPWQASATENLKEIWRESELSSEDLRELDNALPDVLRDTAKTESASLKMKRILGKMGKPLYEVAIKVVADVASETAKKTIGLG